MKFCEHCGSYMKKTTEGFSCTKCGSKVRTKIIEFKDVKNSELNSVIVANKSKTEDIIVNQICPRCGNSKAFHQFSSISGDHAGIKQERILERFKCTKCLYLWSKS